MLSLGQASAAQEVAIYHSADDSGTNLGTVTINPNQSTVLHLYFDKGSVPSSGQEPCCNGTGDEVLGWDLYFQGLGGVSILSAIVADEVVFQLDSTQFKVNGGNIQGGDLGPTKVADLTVQAMQDGELSLVRGQLIGASLQVHDAMETAVVLVPEPTTTQAIVLLSALLAAMVVAKNRDV